MEVTHTHTHYAQLVNGSTVSKLSPSFRIANPVANNPCGDKTLLSRVSKPDRATPIPFEQDSRSQCNEATT
eukprot:2830634-Amphidinium_carterae.1